MLKQSSTKKNVHNKKNKTKFSVKKNVRQIKILHNKIFNKKFIFNIF